LANGTASEPMMRTDFLPGGTANFNPLAPGPHPGANLR